MYHLYSKDTISKWKIDRFFLRFDTKKKHKQFDAVGLN